MHCGDDKPLIRSQQRARTYRKQIERRRQRGLARTHKPLRPTWAGAYLDRCGYGPRLPFLVISPFAKKNYVSHVLVSQASIPQFVEDNWLNGERLGGGSFDATTGSIVDMFDFTQKKTRTLILDPSLGVVDSKSKN